MTLLRSKTAGSFIRPTANIIYGISFLEALTSKYIEALHGSEVQEKVTLGSSQGAIHVEAVSLDKIREKFARLDRLREISLDNANIVRADPRGSILKTCPSKQYAKSDDLSLISEKTFVAWTFPRISCLAGKPWPRLLRNYPSFKGFQSSESLPGLFLSNTENFNSPVVIALRCLQTTII